jgi:hypothetical protein
MGPIRYGGSVRRLRLFAQSQPPLRERASALRLEQPGLASTGKLAYSFALPPLDESNPATAVGQPATLNKKTQTKPVLTLAAYEEKP